MKKTENKKIINLAIRFTFGVFFITFLSATLSVLLGTLFYFTGLLPGKLNPVLGIIILVTPCIFLGTVFAFFVSKKSFSAVDEILTVVSEIGKGNFDVRIKDIEHPENMKEIAHNINVMAQELKNLELMRKDFIQNFSHEFKTPIVSIQGFTNRLLTKNLTEDEKREYLNIILEESTRLAALSTNTLFMSKLDSMEQLWERAEFMLDEQLRRSVLLLEKHRKSKDINIVMGDLPKIPYSGSEELMKQVWINILSNAIKFTGEGGEVKIAAENAGGYITVSVSDNGIGMNDDTVAHIFDKYYQGDGSHTTDGNGLGLSIVQKIITLAGGKIAVESEEGKGTVFTVVLPA